MDALNFSKCSKLKCGKQKEMETILKASLRIPLTFCNSLMIGAS